MEEVGATTSTSESTWLSEMLRSHTRSRCGCKRHLFHRHWPLRERPTCFKLWRRAHGSAKGSARHLWSREQTWNQAKVLRRRIFAFARLPQASGQTDGRYHRVSDFSALNSLCRCIKINSIWKGSAWCHCEKHERNCAKMFTFLTRSFFKLMWHQALRYYFHDCTCL